MEKKFESSIGIFKKAMEKHPDKAAAIVDDRRCTYGEIFEYATKIAGHPSRCNVRKGDPVVIISVSHADYAETVLGCTMIGIVVIKLSWRLAALELYYLLFFNHVKYMFFCPEGAKIRGEMKELTSPLCLAMDMDLMDKILGQWEPLEEFVKRDDDHVLMHLHTSGTTGFPKVARYTNGELLKQTESCIGSLLFESSAIFQMISQVFHSVSMGTCAYLVCGDTAVGFSRFDPVRYIASVEVSRVIRLSTIPTVLAILLNRPDLGRYDVSSMRTISYSIYPMPPELIRRAIGRFRCDFQQSYGMTGIYSIVTTPPPEDRLRCDMWCLNLVGKPIAEHEVKIVHENGGECSAGEVGEICVKDPGMMKDYHQMEEKIMAPIRYGWYHTRGIGSLDKEGYLYVCGRKDDMIIPEGENIFPLEVEDVLSIHPDIAGASVMGVRNDYWEEAVHICVILKHQGTLNGQDICNYCRGEIAGYEIPKKVHIYKEFPRTAIGEVMKAGLVRRVKKETGS